MLYQTPTLAKTVLMALLRKEIMPHFAIRFAGGLMLLLNLMECCMKQPLMVAMEVR